MRKTLLRSRKMLMKGGVLRSKAMMPMCRLPFLYIFLILLNGINFFEATVKGIVVRKVIKKKEMKLMYYACVTTFIWYIAKFNSFILYCIYWMHKVCGVMGLFRIWRWLCYFGVAWFGCFFLFTFEVWSRVTFFLFIS